MDKENKTPATFRALRESLGLHRAGLAKHLGVSLPTLKRWEKPGNDYIPEKAWEVLLKLEKAADAHVEKLIAYTENDYQQGNSILLRYWFSQAEFEAENPSEVDGESFLIHNAVARRCAEHLRRAGIPYGFIYGEQAREFTKNPPK